MICNIVKATGQTINHLRHASLSLSLLRQNHHIRSLKLNAVLFDYENNTSVVKRYPSIISCHLNQPIPKPTLSCEQILKIMDYQCTL